MKNLLKLLLISSALLLSHNATAFSGKTISEQCKIPKFKNFSLTEYKAPERIEVAPESKFSFLVSTKVYPTTVKIIAKKKNLKYSFEKKGNYYQINSQIPAEYTGKFVRISVHVTARLECKGKDGWLIKVADVKTEAEPEIENNPEIENQPEEK